MTVSRGQSGPTPLPVVCISLLTGRLRQSTSLFPQFLGANGRGLCFPMSACQHHVQVSSAGSGTPQFHTQERLAHRLARLSFAVSRGQSGPTPLPRGLYFPSNWKAEAKVRLSCHSFWGGQRSWSMSPPAIHHHVQVSSPKAQQCLVVPHSS